MAKRTAAPRGGRERSTVSEGLLRSSSSFAQSAVAAYVGESWDVFYLHLATSVEQLVKAALAHVHPSFIADTSGSFDSLLHLCGMGDRARTPDFVSAVRTIPVTEALKRVGRVVDGYQEPGTLVHVLLDTRNGIVHAGHDARQEGEAVLGDVARYVPPLLVAVGSTELEYWADWHDLVQKHAQQRMSAIEAWFERQIQAARDRYGKLSADMADVAMEAFLAAVEPQRPAEDFNTFPVTCPACEHLGLLTGTPEPEWEADWDYGDGQSYIAGVYVDSITLRATRFECRVCRLALDDAGLELAKLDVMTFREGEYDLSRATDYFRRLEADDWDPR